MKKRILAMILTLCVMISVFPTAALAMDGNQSTEITGENSYAYVGKDDKGNVRVWGEGRANASESFELELYSGETLIATTKLNNVGGIIDGNAKTITWSFFYPESTDEYWTTIWEKGHPAYSAEPTEVKLIIDGVVVDTTSVKMSAPDDLNPVIWEELGGVRQPLSGNGTEASPYLINNLDDLKGFRDDINIGVSQYSGKYFKLTADINLDEDGDGVGEEWTPIGYNGKSFKGTFDGAGHTISNLFIEKSLENSSANNGIGLFGRVDDPAVIKNLTITNADVQGSLHVGAVVGLGYTGEEISNVHVNGNITIDGYWYIGGIGGKGYMSKITNCSVIGEEGSYIKGNSGGYVGGIWGFRGEGANTIVDCTVDNVDISGVDRLGGICGIIHYGNRIQDCVVKNSTITALDEDATIVGLVAGANQGTASQYSWVINNQVINTTAVAGSNEIVKHSGSTNIDGITPITCVGIDVVFNSNNKIESGSFEMSVPASEIAEGSVGYSKLNGSYGVCAHKMQPSQLVEPTCTETGINKGFLFCTECDTYFDDENGLAETAKVIIPAIGHTVVVDKAVAATCTKTGLTEGTHCSVCNDILEAQEVVKALGHKAGLKNAKAATCTEKGYTGDKVCTVCEETLEKGTEIAATGHKFVDGVCGACGLSIKVEAEVTDTVPAKPAEGGASGSTTEEKVEVPEVKEVTVVETTETKKAEASVKAEATEIVATTITEGTDKLVEDKVIDKETAANLEAVTAVISGDKEAVTKAVEEGLLTKEEVKAIEETVAKGEAVVKAEISVSEVKKEVVEKTVQAAMEEKAVKSVAKDAVVAQYLDVTVALKAVGKELGTIDKLENPITITVAIPEELKVENAKYYVLRNHDGEVTLLSTTLNADGTVSFTTDQFSTYALVYAKEAAKGSPATGDSSSVMTYGVMAVAAMAVVVVLKKRESFER